MSRACSHPFKSRQLEKFRVHRWSDDDAEIVQVPLAGFLNEARVAEGVLSSNLRIVVATKRHHRPAEQAVSFTVVR
jgi:hypothetical protein